MRSKCNCKLTLTLSKNDQKVVYTFTTMGCIAKVNIIFYHTLLLTLPLYIVNTRYIAIIKIKNTMIVPQSIISTIISYNKYYHIFRDWRWKFGSVPVFQNHPSIPPQKLWACQNEKLSLKSFHLYQQETGCQTSTRQSKTLNISLYIKEPY